ncbi:MAG: hypothetical protein RIR18_158 [Pseudomonadota bacterium]|jgi:hypothetical protein
MDSQEKNNVPSWDDYPVRWDYWMKMKTLTAGQAAHLMVGVDPELPMALRGEDYVSMLVRLGGHIKQTAMDQGFVKASPAAWVEWANSFGFIVHPIFMIKTLESPAPSEG